MTLLLLRSGAARGSASGERLALISRSPTDVRRERQNLLPAAILREASRAASLQRLYFTENMRSYAPAEVANDVPQGDDVKLKYI